MSIDIDIQGAQAQMVSAGVLFIILIVALTTLILTWRKKVMEVMVNEAKADGWDEGYAQGVEDELTAEDYNAGSSEPVSPNRQNPYRTDS